MANPREEGKQLNVSKRPVKTCKLQGASSVCHLACPPRLRIGGGGREKFRGGRHLHSYHRAACQHVRLRDVEGE